MGFTYLSLGKLDVGHYDWESQTETEIALDFGQNVDWELEFIIPPFGNLRRKSSQMFFSLSFSLCLYTYIQ